MSPGANWIITQKHPQQKVLYDLDLSATSKMATLYLGQPHPAGSTIIIITFTTTIIIIIIICLVSRSPHEVTSARPSDTGEDLLTEK
ncbi:hypothetical protein CRENBAI_002009 [Crenichthys baileyi]|uniref:Uncharacterized protein n=1 Tax=Crenichthys baileyi TaxID=28760 RepID=A0AAV9SG43_9TELE